MSTLDDIITGLQHNLDDLKSYRDTQAQQPPTTTPPPAGGGTTTPPAGGGSTSDRPFFRSADWLWGPIPTNPVLDGNTASWAQQLAQPKHVALTEAYATTLVTVQPGESPRRATCPISSGWGTKALNNVPVPSSNPGIASGGDKAVGIIDYAAGRVFSMWVAQWSSSGWRAEAGSDLPIDGDGIERGGVTSTGACLARAACIVTRAEIAAGVVPHALFFSTDIAKRSEFRAPATKTDGSNMRNSSNPIPEGARVQLDPSIDLTKISGITRFELAIGQALQRYGMYVGDNGGSRVSISCERGDYSAYGAGGDYYGFPHLPWDKLRVLRQWDGK